MTDFGQPKRLVTRENLRLHLLWNEQRTHQEISMMMSSTFILVGACLVVMLVLFLAILLLCHCCSCRKPRVKATASHATSWKNISPNTPDTRLIDHEYITTTTSLPRVISREQRIYPTLSYDHQHKLLSNSSLDQIHLPPPPLYSAQTSSIRSDYQQHLSMNDINKYLERFEKIYNHSSDDAFRDPVGSVV